MDKRVSFVISQIAAVAIDLGAFRANVRLQRLGGRVTTIRRGNGHYIKCSHLAADYLIRLLLQRAVGVGSTGELLIECSCAVQAICEVYDPRVSPTLRTPVEDSARRSPGAPPEAIRMIGGSCDGLHLIWDADMKPVYLNTAGQQVPSRCQQGVGETYTHTFFITTDAIEKVLSFVAPPSTPPRVLGQLSEALRQ